VLARRARYGHRVSSRRSRQAGSLPADAAIVGDTRLSSTLKRDGASISTVEHLMSALAGLGIDNLHVDVAGPEIRSWTAAPGRSCSCCSRRASSSRTAKRYLRILQPVEVRKATSGRASIRSTASSSISRSTFRIRCSAARTAAW
jgi:UDP-3-O-acyl-N-acetylglucosamine deacetylase